MKKTLLAGVASLALLSAVADKGQAQDLPPLYIQLEGGMNFVNGDEAYYAVDRGTNSNLDLKGLSAEQGDTFRGRAAIGVQLEGGWDLRFSYTGISGNQGSETAANYDDMVPPGNRPGLSMGTTSGQGAAFEYNVAQGQVDSSYHALDFEAGYDLGLGEELDLQLIGGLRYVNYQHKLFAQFGYTLANLEDDHETDDAADFTRDNKFWGLGPKIGVAGHYALGSGFSLFGGVDGAVLFGKLDRRNSMDFDFFNNPNYYRDEREKRSRTAWQLGGEVGLGYDLGGFLGTGGMIELGYRADYWKGLFDSRTEGEIVDGMPEVQYGKNKADITNHGPFMRLTFAF